MTLGQIERRISKLEQIAATRCPKFKPRIIFDDLKGGFNDQSGQPIPPSEWLSGPGEFVIQVIGGRNAR